MSSSNTRTTWRQREAEKARAEQLKRFAKTEENFPSTIASAARAVAREGPGMAERLLEAHIKEEVRKQVEAYRASMQARERRNIVNSVFMFNRSRGGYQEDEESDAGSYIIVEEEKWPGHGRRGTYTEADEDGWRIVTKRLRRKRELTDEEMEQADYNGELTENGQRREFY
jgi:hypothetical protein